jgi:hypothetical protein
MAEKIKQPKNIQIKQDKMQVQLAWKQTFGKDKTERFESAQKFVDSECMRLMVPYTPMLNGILMKSAALGTKIGSGHIYYLNPYARYQYYGKLMVSSITGSAFASAGEKKVLTSVDLVHNTSRHQQAGPFWFDRMKADKAEQILRGAAKYSGGTPIG